MLQFGWTGFSKNQEPRTKKRLVYPRTNAVSFIKSDWLKTNGMFLDNGKMSWYSVGELAHVQESLLVPQGAES